MKSIQTTQSNDSTLCLKTISNTLSSHGQHADPHEPYTPNLVRFTYHHSVGRVFTRRVLRECLQLSYPYLYSHLRGTKHMPFHFAPPVPQRMELI